MKSILRNALFILIAFALSTAAGATTVVFDSYWSDLLAGNVNPTTDTVYCTLHTSSMTPNKGTWSKASSLTNEVSGTGYTAGGKACTVTVSTDTTNHRIDVTFSAVSWTTATISGGAYICASKHRGGASSADNLYGCADLSPTLACTAGTCTVTFTAPIRIQN